MIERYLAVVDGDGIPHAEATIAAETHQGIRLLAQELTRYIGDFTGHEVTGLIYAIPHFTYYDNVCTLSDGWKATGQAIEGYHLGMMRKVPA